MLLDLRAGFDVINPKIILSKLKLYGFDECSLAWFHDYLSERSQCVQIESKLSEFVKVHWGLPQGSQLSPLLFTIFIMELPEVVKATEDKQADKEERDKGEDIEVETETKAEEVVSTPEDPTVVIYADDNTPCCTAENLEDLKEATENIAKKTVDWFSRNEMIVSSDKTKLIFIGSQRNRRNKIPIDYKPEVKVDKDLINLSSSEKLLGLTINETLSWNNFFYGDEEEIGLVRTLSLRVGILKR